MIGLVRVVEAVNFFFSELLMCLTSRPHHLSTCVLL